MDLSQIENWQLNSTIKGIPGGITPFPLRDIAQQGWNVLRGDLPFPLAVLKQSAIEHNSRWMQQFIAHTGTKFCPHGKTTMSPQLFQHQLNDGAWGITLATMHQVQVARRFGVNRIILANQLVGRVSIEYIANEISHDPNLEFYCLVDSVEGAALLAKTLRDAHVARPVNVLLEIGIPDKRSGVRDFDDALNVARMLQVSPDELNLCGIEGFEGLLYEKDTAAAERKVRDFLRRMVEVARQCHQEHLFASHRIILSAGGSAYYDLVAEVLSSPGIDCEVDVVIRSGCYFSHDALVTERFFQDITTRSELARQLGPGPRSALEVWSYVQSRPEPTRAILTLGKRDCSFDIEMPVPTHFFPAASSDSLDSVPLPIPPEHRIVSLNDQHAMLELPANSPLRVGDMIASGISHPCTTFDRWQFMPVVDDRYNVVAGIRTFF